MKNNIIILIAGIACITISFCLFIYYDYEDNIAGKKANIITQELTEEIEKEGAINNLEYIGIIKIPSLNLELPVMDNWSYENMKKAPVRYYGSFDTNDLVICAHSYKNFFRYIKNLKKGDVLIFINNNGDSYLYEVKTVEVLDAEDIKKMIESEFDLTLFTCTSDSQDRITVRLNRVS